MEWIQCRWYSDMERANPNKKFSKVNFISANMMGTKEKPAMKLKADETRGILTFTMHLLKTQGSRLPQNACTSLTKLVRAGECLDEMLDIFKSHTRAMPSEDCKRCVDLCDEHLDLIDALGIKIIPKHHLFQHMVAGIEELGNPRCVLGSGNLFCVCVCLCL